MITTSTPGVLIKYHLTCSFNIKSHKSAMKGESMQKGAWRLKQQQKNLCVLIISEKSIRKLFKIEQVSRFETKQTKKGFACF